MDIKKTGRGTMITLNQAFGSRIKLLNLSYGILFFLAGHAFLITYIRTRDKDLGWAVFYFVVLCVFYIGSLRFIIRAISSEKLFIGPREFRLIKKKLFRSKSVSYDIRKIENLHYVENKPRDTQRKTEPPANLTSFLIRDPIIDQVGNDNKIAFDYENQQVFFGSDITSYEFDDIKSVFDHTLKGVVHKG